MHVFFLALCSKTTDKYNMYCWDLQVVYNRETGQSRGFGFVTMSTIEEADKAIETFNRYVSAYQSSNCFLVL